MTMNGDGQELTPEAPGEPQEGPGYEMPTPPPLEGRRALTAFLVVVEADGTGWATSDIHLDLVLDRQANMGDLFRGCSEVIRDVQVGMVAERTVNMMLTATAQMAEQQRQEKIAMKLASKGIHVPGR